MKGTNMLHAANWTHAGNIRPADGNYASPLDIRERIEACGAAGFSGMGFVFIDIENALAKYPARDIRAMFADNDIEHVELEALTGWYLNDATCVDEAARLAEAIGARQIKAIGDTEGDTSIDLLANAFAAVCDRFQELDAKVVIELMQISNLDTIEKGRAVVEGAGRENGGLLFDSWHVVRCSMDLTAIASLPPGLFSAIELCGVPREPVFADRYAEMVDLRLQPDEGDFDNVRFVQAARKAGFSGLWGIEIVAEKHRALPVAQAVKRSAQAMRSILQRAG